MAFNVEELFDSIKVIVTQELNNVSYDTTVIATIVDDSNKAKGHYVVSDGTIKFDAYTNDTEYKTGDQVRVTVINGDWSQRKFIEGKYVNESTTAAAATYIPPLGTTIAPGGSEFDIPGYAAQTSWTLLTNQSPEVVLFKQVIPADDKFYALQANGIYNTITISADVNTDLGQLKSGNYGLRLDLLITPELGSTSRIQRFMSFDSSEMLGNPYTFVIDTRQEKSIPIYSAGYVTEIVLSAYQGYTINSDGTTQAEPFKYMNDTDASGLPITFSNVHLGFGSDLSQITDNKLQLYTADSAVYQYDEGKGHSSNHKKMGLMWYNKTEDNQYIGFSDGIYDQTYDEITYLEDSYADSRLTEHLGKTSVAPDETSLRLAANIQDAEPLMKSAYTTLTTGLAQILQRFQKHLTGATTILEQLNPLILIHLEGEGEEQESKSAKLVQAADEAKAAATALKETYLNVLQYGYNVSQGIEENEWSADWVAADNYTAFVTTINNGITLVEDFLTFTEQETATGKTLSGYRGFYNDYKPKIKSQLQIITNYLDQLKILKGDYAKLQGYAPTAQTKHDYTAYVKSDFADRANKYCIYWYRYKEGYALSYITPVDEESWNAEPTEHADYATYKAYCDKNNREYQFANFLGPNWERLEKKYDVAIDENGTVTISNETDLINFGLPESYIEKDVEQEDGTIKKVKYWNANPVAEQLLSRWLDPCTETERYRVVMFYNHEQINSTILTFDNQDEVPPQYKTDAGDVLRIEHHTDSRDHYQAYSPACDLLNISDGSKSRQLKLFYDGVLSGDETLADAEVYWYIPVNSTMLTYDRQFLINKGFNTDDNYTTDEEGNEVKVTTPYSKEGYVYFSKKIGYDTAEEPMLDENGQQVYNSEGQPQTNEVITLTEADRYFFYRIKSFFEASAQNNTILVHAYVPNKEEPTVGEISFTFSTFGSNGTKYTLVMTPQTTQIAVLPNITEEDGSVTDGDLKLTLSLYNADGELQEMGTDMMSDTTFWNLQTSWYSKNTGALAMADAEPIADSYQRTITIYNDGNNNGLGYDDNCYIGVAKAEVSLTEEIKDGADSRTITLSTLYPVSWASNPDFYISGPTMIVYNSQGTVSRLSEEPYCLYQHTLDGDIKVENQSWSLIYYKGEGESVPADELPYQPTLNKDNTLRPAPMYYHACDADGNEIDHKYVPVAVCKVDGNIAWTQPIIVSQNKYESSMLNAWDGSLEINEANGTIMSTMVGAGIKNQDNTFSGVLMGDIVAGADFDPSNANGIGIYGFHEGEQSFNFSVKGTAFLGKSGHGRIYFDGNQGFIYSASWLNSFEEGEEPFGTVTETDIDGNDSQYVVLNQGKDGLAIDLRTGHIDAYNFKLTSKNIYLNSSPDMESEENDYYFSIGNLDDEDGNEPSPGLLTFDREGNLKIQVNHLTLTGNLGGTNLLLNTAPKSYLGLTGETQEGTNPTTGDKYYTEKSGELWDFEPWTPTDIISVADEDNKESVFTISANTGISQTIIEIKDGVEYMASVYVKPASGQIITMATANGSVSSVDTGWQYLTLLFTAVSGDTITFSSNSGSFKIWHPKVEEGTIAITWAESPQDAKIRESRLGAMFTQDGLWSSLSNNGTTQGVWLQNGELYINATHIAAGALFSANWKTSGGTLADDGSITKYGTAGMAISLKTGQIHSANFQLNAGTKNTENYIGLFSTDTYSPTLTIGNSTSLSTWRIVAGKNFGVTKMGTLYAKNADISGDIYADYIEADSGVVGGWKIGTESLYYGAELEKDATVKLNGADGTITLGKNFTATNEGLVTATNAVLNDLTVNTTLRLQGKAHIAPAPSSGVLAMPTHAQLMISGGTLIKGKLYISDGAVVGTSMPTNAQMLIGGGSIIKGKLLIDSNATYASSLPENAQVLIKGIMEINNNIIMTGTNAIIANSYTLDDSSATWIRMYRNGIWFYGNLVTISPKYVQFINTDGGTHPQVTFQGRVQLWNVGEFMVYAPGTTNADADGYVNLEQYIKNNAGSWFNISMGSDNVAITNVAKALGSSNSSITLKAPVAPTVSTDVTAQALVATKTDGTTEWRDIENNTKATYLYASDNLVTANTVYHALPKINGSHIYYSNTSIYAPKSMGTNGQVLTTSITGGGTSQVTSFAWKDMSALIPTATASTYGTVKVHSVKATAVTVNSATTTANRYYRVEMNNDGKLFVNIPWTDTNTTYDTDDFAAASHTHGGGDITSAVDLANNVRVINQGDYTLYYAGVTGAASSKTMFNTGISSASNTSGSSLRFKHSITNSIDSSILYQLSPVSYFYNEELHWGNVKRYGFIAEEVLQFAPELVEIDSNDNLPSAIYYNSILTLAVAEIQKLRKELDNLKSTLNID